MPCLGLDQSCQPRQKKGRSDDVAKSWCGAGIRGGLDQEFYNVNLKQSPCIHKFRFETLITSKCHVQTKWMLAYVHSTISEFKDLPQETVLWERLDYVLLEHTQRSRPAWQSGLVTEGKNIRVQSGVNQLLLSVVLKTCFLKPVDNPWNDLKKSRKDLYKQVVDMTPPKAPNNVLEISGRVLRKLCSPKNYEA